MAAPRASAAQGSTQRRVVVGGSSRMSLANVRDAGEKVPDRFFGYGPEGVGKSTFAADWPSPVFLSSEDGIHHLSGVKRFPEPHSWTDLMAVFEELVTGKHSFQTLVIDTIDWIEQRI